MTLKNFIFYISLSTLFTHELDAVANHEWRVLILTNWLPDEYGMIVFLFFHIPLFAVLIALVTSTNEKIRIRSRIGISIFLVIHGLLHALYIGSRNYEFTELYSNGLIFGGALLGIIYLILEHSEKQTGTPNKHFNPTPTQARKK